MEGTSFKQLRLLQMKKLLSWRRDFATTSGAFQILWNPNVYKSKQLEKIGEMFCNGPFVMVIIFYILTLGILL